MLVNRSLLLASVTLLCYAIRPVYAEDVFGKDEDTLKLNAGYTVQTDSNLYRLSSSALASSGLSSASERIGISTLGLSINKPYSLQRFELNLNLVDSRYQNFSYLSFIAHNADAAWRWSFTPQLHGNFTTSRKETLNSFEDNQTLNVRNERTETNTALDATYELGSAWHVLGGLRSIKQDSVLPLAAEGNTSTIVGDAGMRYLWASGSTLSYRYRDTSGTYTNRDLQPTTLLDNEFNQRDHEVKLHWAIDGKTTADLTGAYINRSHTHYSQRNYSGFNATASAYWSISGKSLLQTRWAHELASYQDTVTNFTRTDRLTLAPTWQVSPKVAVRLSYEILFRDYLGSPSASASSGRKDTIQNSSVAVDWLPYRNMTLTTSFQKAKRSSNQSNLDFNSNMASFTAQYSF